MLKFYFSFVSSTEILLEWRRPDVVEIDQYVIKYNAVGAAGSMEIKRLVNIHLSLV